jgi:hypothetical protein
MIIRKGNKVVANIENGKLTKHLLDESIHLLWKFGGVPCIDAEMWDRHKDRLNEIVITTHKGNVFTISRDNFEKDKKDFDLGYSRQYYVELESWNVKRPPEKTFPAAFAPKKEIKESQESKDPNRTNSLF